MKIKLFFALLILAALASCKQGVKTTDIRMKKIVSLIRPDSSTFTYSPEGKLIEHITFSGSMTQNFLYEKNRVIEEGMGPMNNEPFHLEYTLNEKGQAVKSVRTTAKDTTCVAYVYNSDGYKTEEYLGCDKEELIKKRVIENGNLIIDTLFTNSRPAQIIRYFYYDLPNRPTAFGEELQGYTFKGKDSKNLLKQMVLVQPPDKVLYDAKFTYKFDDQDRVSILSIYDQQGRVADSSQYYY